MWCTIIFFLFPPMVNMFVGRMSLRKQSEKYENQSKSIGANSTIASFLR